MLNRRSLIMSAAVGKMIAGARGGSVFRPRRGRR